MSWIDVGNLNDIPLRGSRIVKSSAGCIAIFRTDENEAFATSNTCPHKQGPLSEGIVHGRKVTCPLHNWVFSLETGQAQGADQGQIATYPVKIVDGRLLLELTVVEAESA